MSDDDLSTYLNRVVGDQPGHLCLAFGSRPYRDARTGKYRHRDWDEVSFSWPAERDLCVAEVHRQSASGVAVDVFVCPAVRTTGRRRGTIAPPTVVWADLDAPSAASATLVEGLGALVVDSGSPGHQHVYLPLSRPVTAEQHEALNRALARLLGADAKWSNESLLRLPGTLNHKSAVPPEGQDAGEPSAVRISATGAGPREPEHVARMLGVDLSAAQAVQAPAALEIVPERAPDVLPHVVRIALDHPDVADRSQACCRVISACHVAGLTAGQAVAVLRNYGPAERYGSAERLVADVARLWEKPRTMVGDVRDLIGAPGPAALAVVEPAPAALNLPPEFWESRPVLRHVRQAAHARGRSADLVLLTVLCRLSAMVGPKLRFDVGLGPGSLNLFAALVGPSGVGKTAGVALARELAPAPERLTFNDEFRDGLPLGSGEGIAESFMGWTVVEGEPTSRGTPRTTRVRAMVRDRAFLHVDEGEALTRTGERAGSTIMPTIRSAWIGELLGQANASQDSTRIVPAGSYSVGAVIGFQRMTAQPLVSDSATGTAQRFVWGSATDPSVPDSPPEWPGRLHLPLTDSVGLPLEGVITAEETIRTALWTENLARARGQVTDDDLASHRALTLAKVAALLAVLDERNAISAADWELAGAVWATSCAVRDDVIAFGRAEAERVAERRTLASVERAERTAARVNSVSDTVDRIAGLVAAKLREAGGTMTRGALRRALASRDRHMLDDAVEHGERLGLFRADERVVALPAAHGAAS